MLFVGTISDFQIRDLNDEINKLMREKYRWEQQIVDLGGVDYRVNYRRTIFLTSLGRGTTIIYIWIN